MKVGIYELAWDRSPVSGIERVEVTVVNDGVTVKTTVGPDVVAQQVRVKALTDCRFKVETFHQDGRSVMSVEHSFSAGTLEDLQPATNLRHRLLQVVDEDDSPPPEDGGGSGNGV